VICDARYFSEKSFSYDFCKFYAQGLINLSINMALSFVFIFAFYFLEKITLSAHRERS